MKRYFALLAGLLLAVILILVACVAPTPIVTDLPAGAAPAGQATESEEITPEAEAEGEVESNSVTEPPGRGMGMQSGMMARHHAQVPEVYASLVNPVLLDEDLLARGGELFTANCATCHGEDGMGETEIGQALDPPVAPIAHTSRMLSDGYLFWRISEGGAPFASAMPAWREALDEQARWDLINYVRNIGSGRGMGQGMGRGPGPQAGMGMDEAGHRAEMLADAMAQGVITGEEAELFERVHQVLDELYPTSGMEGMEPGGMMAMQRSLTDQAVRAGHISQADADQFTEIHDRLLEADVMQ